MNMIETIKNTKRKMHVCEIPVNSIKPNPNQPRRFFDATALRELSESIIQYGVIQPITVRKIRCGYELVTGERRMRATQLAGIDTIPAITRRNCI